MPPSAFSRSRIQGFTLIEVMVTVAVIGILAAIAVPSYRDYILRGNVVDATNGLAVLRADMERHFQDNRTYKDGGTGGIYKTPCSTATQVGSFTLGCDGTPDDTTYTLKAEGSGNTAGFTYKINEKNVRSTTITGSSGWAGCASAWVMKRGQAC